MLHLVLDPYLWMIVVGSCKDAARIGEMVSTSGGIWNFPLTSFVVHFELGECNFGQANHLQPH